MDKFERTPEGWRCRDCEKTLRYSSHCCDKYLHPSVQGGR